MWVPGDYIGVQTPNCLSLDLFCTEQQYSTTLESLLFWIFHYMQPNLILTITKGKIGTKQPVDRYIHAEERCHDRPCAHLLGVHWNLWSVGSSVMGGSQRWPLHPRWHWSWGQQGLVLLVWILVCQGYTPGVWGIQEPPHTGLAPRRTAKSGRVSWERKGRAAPGSGTFTVALADLSHPQLHHHTNSSTSLSPPSHSQDPFE